SFAGMQTWDDAERLALLGLPVNRMEITGSLKFEAAGGTGVPAPDLKAFFRGAEGRLVVVAGSTAAGEESALLDAIAALPRAGAGREPLLVLAPRRPERFDEVR